MTNKKAPIYIEKADMEANSPSEEPSTPVIARLKKELDEAWDCELTARQLGHSVERWEGYQSALRLAIKIVEKMK